MLLRLPCSLSSFQLKITARFKVFDERWAGQLAIF